LYRLQVFDILLPPLRDRVSDVPLLAGQFLADCARTMGRRIPRLLDEALDALLAHDWPGNVRELRNVLERASILTDGDIECRHLSLRRKSRPPAPTDDLQNIERVTIERVLDETNWNKSRAARRLGLTRTQLYGRLRRYSLGPPPPFTDSGSMRPSVRSQGPRRLDRKHVFPRGKTKAAVQRAVENHRAEDLHKHGSL
jgi:DNA-binding NtrC family response regulator